MAETLRGVVKWFNDAKGFGFIEHESGKDVFVHYSVIEWDGFKTLKDGEEVDYELKEGEKGLHAARVARPTALKKKLEKEVGTDESTTAAAGDSKTLIAPKLETGTVNTGIRSASEMIEIEKDETATQLSDDAYSERLKETRASTLEQ